MGFLFIGIAQGTFCLKVVEINNKSALPFYGKAWVSMFALLFIYTTVKGFTVQEIILNTVYHLTFDLTTSIEFSEGTYWLQPIMSSSIDDYVWWLTITTGSHGAVAQRNTDAGVSWYPDPAGYQMVFFVAGDCNALGVNDINSFDFDFYPNPVKDVLNIKSQIEVKSVEVINIIGQKVVIGAQVNNGQINVMKLTPGTYVDRATFENGQVKTFKFIKK